MNSFMLGMAGRLELLAAAAAAAAAAATDGDALLDVIVAVVVVTVDVWPVFDEMLRLRLCRRVSLICELEIPDAAATWANAFSADRPYSSRLVFWKSDA